MFITMSKEMSVSVLFLPFRVIFNIHILKVQLSTTHSVTLALPPSITPSSATSSASKIFALIEAEEGRYQTSLNDAYAEMGEKTFKGLRRALPMTRSKLDWDKVSGLLASYYPHYVKLLVVSRFSLSDGAPQLAGAGL